MKVSKQLSEYHMYYQSHDRLLKEIFIHLIWTGKSISTLRSIVFKSRTVKMGLDLTQSWGGGGGPQFCYYLLRLGRNVFDFMPYTK